MVGNRDEELERICCNCQKSFPADPDEGRFCICLDDQEFEPFLDELLERMDYSRCKDLVARKRFPNEREACEEFDPVESCELSPELAEKISRLCEEDNLNKETFLEAVMEVQVDKIDWSKISPDQYMQKMRESRNRDGRKDALDSLGGLISMGNHAAFRELLQYMRELPLPRNIEEVHFRTRVLDQLTRYREFDKELVDVLFEDLSRIPSNNTTRGWWTAVLRYLRHNIRKKSVKARLENMLGDKRFAYRIKKKIRHILDDDSWP